MPEEDVLKMLNKVSEAARMAKIRGQNFDLTARTVENPRKARSDRSGPPDESNSSENVKSSSSDRGDGAGAAKTKLKRKSEKGQKTKPKKKAA